MWKSIAVLALFATLAPSTASAAAFSVSPTRIILSAGASSVLLSLTNESQEPIRLQMRAHAWQQSPDGDVQLGDTEDLIVFPGLVTLKPGEQRNVRVAFGATVGAVEKTYRVFVEELPSTPAGDAGTSAVRVLTRMGIPVFVQPARIQAVASVRDVGLSRGRLTFTLANDGNSFFIPDVVQVRALGGGGETVEDQSIAGWYVLAGGYRRYALDFDAARCAQIRSATIEVKVGETVLKAPLTTPGGACAVR